MEIRERKNFLDFIKGFYVTILIYIFAEIIGKYISIYIATVVGNATNSIINKNYNYIMDNVALLVILFIISSLVMPMISFMSSKLYVNVGVKFDISSYGKFLKQKRSLLDKYEAGELVYRIPEDQVGYVGGLLTVIGDGAVVLFVIFQCFYVMGKIHMSFAIICLSLSTLPILLIKCFDTKLKNLYSIEQEALSKISNCERNVIENFAFIKTHILNNKVLNMFKEVYSYYYKIYKKKLIITNAIDSFKELFFIVCEISIYIIGSYYIAAKQLTIGDSIKFFVLFFMLKENAKLLSTVLINYSRFKASSKRYLEWTGNEEEFGTKTLDSIYPIAFQNVSFKYDDIDIINNLSFHINEGDHVVIEGKNGSGKSTLLKLLTGIYSNYEGNIYINNCELKTLNIHWLREQINVVSQNSFLFNLSVFDNIKYCCPQSSDKEIEDVLKCLDIYDLKDKIAGEDGEYLSGGQKQKIALARTLVSKSPVTVLDEPDNALDSKTKDYILNVLSKSKNTIIVISHNEKWKNVFSNKEISL